MLVSTVISCAWIALGVFVWTAQPLVRMSRDIGRPCHLTLHDTTQSIEDGLGSKVLGRNKIYKVLLPPLLFLDDVVDGGIGLFEVC